MDVSKRAKVLVQAMPYIKKYAGETIVVKYGGNAMINEKLKSAVMSDLVLMQLVGINVVLVHGGGPEINAMLDAVGKESKFENGMRVTDKETIDIVQMVLAGKVNKSLVQLLESHGGNAIGFCGLDGRLLMAEKLVSSADLGFVGEIKEVNPAPIEMAMKDWDNNHNIDLYAIIINTNNYWYWPVYTQGSTDDNTLPIKRSAVTGTGSGDLGQCDQATDNVIMWLFN